MPCAPYSPKALTIGSLDCFWNDSNHADGRASTLYMPSMNSVVCTSSDRNVEASTGFLALLVWKNVRTPTKGWALCSSPFQVGIGHIIRSSPSAFLESGVCHGPEIRYGGLTVLECLGRDVVA